MLLEEAVAKPVVERLAGEAQRSRAARSASRRPVGAEGIGEQRPHTLGSCEPPRGAPASTRCHHHRRAMRAVVVERVPSMNAAPGLPRPTKPKQAGRPRPGAMHSPPGRTGEVPLRWIGRTGTNAAWKPVRIRLARCSSDARFERNLAPGWFVAFNDLSMRPTASQYSSDEQNAHRAVRSSSRGTIADALLSKRSPDVERTGSPSSG